MIHETLPMQVEGSLAYAEISTYFLDTSKEMKLGDSRPVIVICPGGGYEFTSDREAEPLAVQFLSMGYHAVVLRYSVKPAAFPIALMELAKTVAFLRENAEKYHIDKDKIVIMGSSSGGHLAASLGVFWNQKFLLDKLSQTEENIKPNGLILNYPVITSGEFSHSSSFDILSPEKNEELRAKLSLETQVGSHTPKTFLWHTFTDDCVPVQNSLLFANALVSHKVPVELHIYPVGGHGLSLANEITLSSRGGGIQEECQSWIGLAQTWMKQI